MILDLNYGKKWQCLGIDVKPDLISSKPHVKKMSAPDLVLYSQEGNYGTEPIILDHTFIKNIGGPTFFFFLMAQYGYSQN